MLTTSRPDTGSTCQVLITGSPSAAVAAADPVLALVEVRAAPAAAEGDEQAAAEDLRDLLEAGGKGPERGGRHHLLGQGPSSSHSHKSPAPRAPGLPGSRGCRRRRSPTGWSLNSRAVTIPEVASAAVQTPEQVGVLLGTRPAQHDRRRSPLRHSWTESSAKPYLRDQPAEAAAQCVADDAQTWVLDPGSPGEAVRRGARGARPGPTSPRPRRGRFGPCGVDVARARIREVLTSTPPSQATEVPCPVAITPTPNPRVPSCVAHRGEHVVRGLRP